MTGPGVHGIECVWFNRPQRFNVRDKAFIVALTSLGRSLRADVQSGNTEALRRKPLAQWINAAANVKYGALPIVPCCVRRICLYELAGPAKAHAFTLVVAVFHMPGGSVDQLLVFFAHYVSSSLGVTL